MLKYALLGFLRYQPMSGYDLETHIRQSTAHFWHARLSQIYMTLKELEGDGWVSSRVEPQDKRPDRRVYHLTDTGRAALQAWVETTLDERSQAKDPLLLKLFFSAPAGKAAIIRQLQSQVELHRSQLKLYEGEIPSVAVELLAEQPHLQDDSLLWTAVRDFGLRYEQMYIAWLEDTLRRLEDEFPATS